MRSLLGIACLVGLMGCHTRYAKQVESLSEVRLVPETKVGPDVDLGRIYTTDPGLVGVMADTYNLSQMIRESRLTAIIAEKIDAGQINAAFVYGIRENLGDGPPFAAVDDAGPRMELAVVDWGLEVTGSPYPGVFTYKVQAKGVLPDGRKFYRSTFRCTGDAGEAKWIDAYGVSSRDERRLRELPSEVVQETFDKAAYACGHEFAEKLKLHAGL